MREYETMVLIRPDLAEPDFQKLIQQLEGILCRNGGEVIHKENWGVKRLAYPIQKMQKGHYVVYNVSSTQADVAEFERVIKINSQVLRAMVLKMNNKVDVEARRLEIQKKLEEARLNAAENSRDRADNESMAARRGGFRGERSGSSDVIGD